MWTNNTFIICKAGVSNQPNHSFFDYSFCDHIYHHIFFYFIYFGYIMYNDVISKMTNIQMSAVYHLL